MSIVFLELLLPLFGAGCPAPPAAQDGAAFAQLRRVAQAQWTEEVVLPVQGFALDLNLREREQGAREVDIQVYYRTERGGLLRLVMAEPDRGPRVEKGFDGRRYWLKEQDQPLLDLGERSYAQDRQAIDDALDLCERLLLVIDLKRLEEQVGPDLALEHTKEQAGGELARFTLRGKLRFGEEQRGFALEVDSITLLPLVLRLEPEPDAPPDAPAAPEESQEPAPVSPPAPLPAQVFRLSAYKDFAGRRIPQLIDEYRGDDPAAKPVRRLELRQVEWRRPPAPESFLPPKE